jgi:hypothetical protein
VTRISEFETEKEFDYTSWQIIELLQQQKIWDVEVEMEKYYSDEFGNNDLDLYKPKITTNNSIKVIKIL